MDVPVAKDKGIEIVGVVRTEIVVDEDGVFSMPLSADPRIVSYEAATTDKSTASLNGARKILRRSSRYTRLGLEFAAYEKDSAGKELLRPSTTDLYLRSGFKPNHIYEFIYSAKNPLVLGLGFAAVRDTVSFLRYEKKDKAGNPNPLAPDKNHGGIHRAYAWAGLSAPDSFGILFTMVPMKTNRTAKFSKRSVPTSPAAEECFSTTSLPGR
jgi:hypothetical protein